eukprot:gene30066-35035_t
MSVPTPAAPVEWKGGELLFAGGTDWAMLGRAAAKGKKDTPEELERAAMFPNVLLPSKMKSLVGIKIAFIAAGPCAVHCMAGDMEGRLYTWGRNEKGQLGHGDKVQRNTPKIVEALANEFVVSASAGKFHSSVVTKSGASYTWGLNQQGQLGMGSIKKGPTQVVKGAPKFEDMQLSPVKASLPVGVTATACGADFTLWIAGGKLYAAGNPQYGQIGDGSDHQYNAKDSSISIVFDAQPKPKLVPDLATKTVTRIACGTNHSVAVDSEGSCYTWGCGNYGRLGHRVQKDEFAPKKVEEFRGRITVPPDAIVAAGSTSTFCQTTIGGQMYSWGKLKTSGDNQMYPNVLMDLAGWNVKSMACGPATFAVSADNSVITWGAATNGELGYGPSGRKSSANPDKCSSLEGLSTHQVACGAGFTMFLVDSEAAGEERMAKIPVFEIEAPEEEAAVEEEDPKAKGKGKAAAGKRKAEPAKAPAKGKKAK